jgi:hypothetical protein
MSAIAMVALSLLGYVVTAVGLLRPFYLSDYKFLREPKNGVQMPVLDAKRNAIKSAAGFAFAWPGVLVLFGLMLPLVVVFDLVPKGVKALGRGIAAGSAVAGPVVAGPLINWVSAPVEREIAAETALALEARADAGEGPPSPLIPDSIALWEPPTGMSLRDDPPELRELLHWGEDER